jgi:putative ATP-binding cassette transporter
MLRDLAVVTGIVEEVIPGFRLRVFVLMALEVIFNFGLVYFQILALQHQRANQPDFSDALRYAAAVLGFVLSVRYVWNYTSHGLAWGVHALTTRIVRRLNRLSLDGFERLGRGTLMMRLTGDTRRVVDATAAVVGAPLSVLRLGIGAVFALSMSPGLAIVMVLAMISMGVVIATQLQGMSTGFSRVAGEEVRMYELLRGHIAGANAIKQHRARAGAIGEAFSKISTHIRELKVGMFGLFFERQHLANAILYGVLGVNVFILPLLISTDSETVRELNLVLVWGASSVIGVVATLPELSQAADSARRLIELEAQLSDDVLEPPADATAVARGRLRGFETLSVRGLEFSYPESGARTGFHVGPIDLELRRGEIVFITGDNGSGKSTFLNMLTGLYPAAAGQLVLDETPITSTELTDYRVLFATVFTDHHLFARVVGFEGDDQARASELLRDMQIAHVTDIVDGRVTNRALSSGQKKRLAMVVARLQDRPILVFDEWAADQDPEFRVLYYTRILPELKAAGKLVIAVTHDDQYFHCADRIIHFRAGRLDTVPPVRGAS